MRQQNRPLTGGSRDGLWPSLPMWKSENEVPKKSYAVYNKASGLELEVDAAFATFLEPLNGQYSARQVLDRYVGDGAHNPPLEGALAAFTREALQQGANKLLLGLLHQGFLVERRKDDVHLESLQALH